MNKTLLKAAPDNPASLPDKHHPSGEHDAVVLWLRLLACHNQIETYLRHRFRDSFELTLPRFDLMAQLDRHPEGLRMREVSRLLMVTGGNVTGLTDRLVSEGLIVRKEDPSDRRAYFICLTPKGKAQFAEMAVAHKQWLVSLFSSFEEKEIRQLSDLLGNMKKQLGNK